MSKLTNNTATMEQLLAKVKALPEAGGGGGDGSVDDILDGSVTEIVSQVTSLIAYALRNRTNLQKASFPNVTTLNGNAFYGCTKLEEIYLPELTKCSTSMNFSTCRALKEISLPKATSIGSQSFYSCTSLTKVDLGAASSISDTVFYGCSSLVTLILRSKTMATLSNTSSLNSTPIKSGTGYIYVPADLVDSYKAATNWSTVAAQFRAIEDYPEITGG